MDLSIGSAIAWMRTEFGKPAPEGAAPDEAATRAIIEHARQAAADASAAAARASETAAPERTDEGARRQAVLDVAYLVAAADGSISAAEKAKLSLGIQGLLGETVSDGSIDDGLDMARVLFEERGLAGAAAAVAGTISEEFERTALLSIASTVAWLGGGVGTKEGLALQALASAFGVPIKVLHQIMAGAATVAKR
jgi:tellurite resistance protein